MPVTANNRGCTHSVFYMEDVTKAWTEFHLHKAPFSYAPHARLSRGIKDVLTHMESHGHCTLLGRLMGRTMFMQENRLSWSTQQPTVISQCPLGVPNKCLYLCVCLH